MRSEGLRRARRQQRDAPTAEQHSASSGAKQSAEALADAVRTRRKQLGVTQIELAQLARCGPVFIYDLESAKRTVRLDKVLDVLDVLGLELVLRPGKARFRVDGS